MLALLVPPYQFLTLPCEKNPRQSQQGPVVARRLRRGRKPRHRPPIHPQPPGDHPIRDPLRRQLPHPHPLHDRPHLSRPPARRHRRTGLRGPSADHLRASWRTIQWPNLAQYSASGDRGPRRFPAVREAVRETLDSASCFGRSEDLLGPPGPPRSRWAPRKPLDLQRQPETGFRRNGRDTQVAVR